MPIVKLSSQRQITLPKWMLELIGAKAHDRLTVKFEANKLILELVKKDLVEELAGSWAGLIPEDKRSISIDKAIKIAKDTAARHIAQEGLK